MVTFQGLVVIFVLVQFGSSEIADGNCNGINCQSPPNDAKCEIVDNSDKDISQPTGPKAHCCRLWKCKRQNDVHFFTFHGLQGAGNGIDGSETVRYENAGQMGRSVFSTADGGHDSVASAGDKLDMDELNAALRDAMM